MHFVLYVFESEKEGLRAKESTWNPQTDLNIWEIIRIFELLPFQDLKKKKEVFAN